MSLLHESNLEVFSLTVSDGGKWSSSPALAGHANKRGEKIYMLVGPPGDATIFYIGQTISAIATRFHSGFRAKARYKYQWSVRRGSYRLFVWDLSTHCFTKTLLEAAEAELVLGARIAQKGWPMYQTGIHFRHIVDQRGRQIAPRLAIEMMGQFYDHVAASAVSSGPGYVDAERENVLSQMEELILPGS